MTVEVVGRWFLIVAMNSITDLIKIANAEQSINSYQRSRCCFRRGFASILVMEHSPISNAFGLVRIRQ